MDLLQGSILALVQGLTEFLPISSSAHLVLVPILFGWPDQGLAFDIAVHVGSLLAVLACMRREIADLVRGWARSLYAPRAPNPAGRHAWTIVIATLPVAIAGFFAGDAVERHLRSPHVIAVANLVFALLLFSADRWGRKSRSERELGLFHALLIGCAQAFALIPGASRSGVTMTAGLALGLDPQAAARFSFLLAVPVIALAGGAQAYELSTTPEAVDWARFGFAAAVAAISAYACMRTFLALVARIGMWPFVAYRIGLGAVLLLVLR